MIKYGSCCMTVFQSLIPLQNPDLPYLLGTSSFPGHAKRTDTANVEHCRRFMSVVSVGSPSRFQQQRQPMCCGAAPWHRTIALGFSKCWWTSQRTLPRSWQLCFRSLKTELFENYDNTGPNLIKTPFILHEASSWAAPSKASTTSSVAMNRKSISDLSNRVQVLQKDVIYQKHQWPKPGFVWYKCTLNDSNFKLSLCWEKICSPKPHFAVVEK